MQAIEVLRDSGKLLDRPVYVLAGEDLFLRREATQAVIQRTLGEAADDLSIHAVKGEDAELRAVLDELRTLPFLAPRRIVIVEEADSFITAHRKELETYCEHPVSTGVFILHVKSFPGTTRLAKIVAQNGVIIECKGAEGRGLLSWMQALARRLQGRELQAEAADLLLDLVGPEPGLIATELEKLAVAVGPDRAIDREDVARLVGGGRVEEVWKAIDAAASGQQAQALVYLDALLASGEPPIKLLGAITYALMRVHHAGQMRVRGVDAREACRRAGVFPGAVDRVLQQHKHLGPKRVGQLPARLLKADLDLKGNSAHPPRVVLEALFAELAQPRKD